MGWPYIACTFGDSQTTKALQPGDINEMAIHIFWGFLCFKSLTSVLIDLSHGTSYNTLAGDLFVSKISGLKLSFD